MQVMASVDAVAPLAEHVKEMPPTATLVKEALSWTRECAREPALRGTWPWRGCASIAQRCVRNASMRKRAKVPGSISGESVALPSHPAGGRISEGGVSKQG